MIGRVSEISLNRRSEIAVVVIVVTHYYKLLSALLFN